MDELSKEAVLVVPDSEDGHEDLTPEDITLLPDSEDEQKDLTPNNVTLLPGCCSGLHDMKDHEMRWLLASRKVCYRCGLMHSNYAITSWIYGLDDFDCEILIPNIDEMNMYGSTLILPQEVLKKLDNIHKKKEFDDNNAEIDEGK
ncbi:hypothetical protein GUJ93_ZPchr0014g47231 [Zizania palustris]|uniref:Uncharacterized protein n=1 Tax=Zizania palustris TaxID=103762 RepID=A0A8J5W5N8_ZIZPA|nr:hypothetical protein GUJ93_ZPchr0014g47231 [Zizania palustris]